MRRPNAKLVKITFNVPTVRVFLSEAKGIRIRLSRLRVMIAATPETDGDDVVALTPRSRGGVEATIDTEGTKSTALLRQLEFAGLSQREPFFTLDSQDGEWINLTHFSGQNSPARHVPHVRIWRMADDLQVTASRRPNIDFVAWNMTRDMIMRAKHVITEFEQHGHAIGRPSNSYIQAKRLLESVHRLYQELQTR